MGAKKQKDAKQNTAGSKALATVSSNLSLAELVKGHFDTNYRKLTGTSSINIARRHVANVSTLQIRNPNKDETEAQLIAYEALAEHEPANSVEAMLATQMIGVHEASVKFLRDATLQEQTEGRDANVMRATRLMRIFTEQVETMQKLKGKAGQQKVTVEHVHVHEGGQAIVGAVSSTKAGGGANSHE